MGHGLCGSWVNCVMGHMGHGSRKMAHFHLCRVGSWDSRRSEVFWAGVVRREDGGRTRQQTSVEKHLTAANCLYIPEFWGETPRPPVLTLQSLAKPLNSMQVISRLISIILVQQTSDVDECE